METFLKKIHAENFRLKYLIFSEAGNHNSLENYTRVKTFILDGYCEIANHIWYKMLLDITNALQSIKPLELTFLLETSSGVGKPALFVDHDKGGYMKTSYGLYIKKYTDANTIVLVIKRLLTVYGFNLDDAYLVVEVAPKYERQDKANLIEIEKEKLKKFINKTFVDSDKYYEVATRVIDSLNKSLQYYSPTSYNNLYLLNSLEDYDRYVNNAIIHCNYYCNIDYTIRERDLAIEWLRHARFYGDDIFAYKPISLSSCVIEDGNKRIPITFENHLF